MIVNVIIFKHKPKNTRIEHNSENVGNITHKLPIYAG